MAVVKANAYGFGAAVIAVAEEETGIEAFATARVSEAMVLKNAGITKDILIFNAFSQAEIDIAVENGFLLSLNNFEMITKIQTAARQFQKKVRIHLKVDTGMGRFGVFPEEIPLLAKMALDAGCIEIDGIFSHYASIDDDPECSFNAVQRKRFEDALDLLRETGVEPNRIHCSNSAGALNTPLTRYNMVRIGSALLGLNPYYYAAFPDFLRRTLTWKTQLVSVRKLPAGYGISYGQNYHLNEDAWVGVIPVGYGDGFRRVKNNEVLIGGKRVPVIGNVCTDASMVLLPQFFPTGEEVILIGRQGSESIEIEDLAKRWNTARADVTSGITGRVARRYL